MTATPTAETLNTRVLDVETSARILARAVEDRATVTLQTCDGKNDVACQGTILSEEGDCLNVELCELGESSSRLCRSKALFACLDHSGGRYLFETESAGSSSRAGSVVLHLSKPATIETVERRRHRRRCLRTRTDVTLSATSGAAIRRIKAAMLNLSEQGLACRVRQTDSEKLYIGQTLGVTLRIAEALRVHSLEGRIANITHGGTPGHAVVGMEFAEGEELDAVRVRLREVLGQSSELLEATVP